MGTSTLFRRFNDLRGDLADMTKEELDRLDKLSPWGREPGEPSDQVRGWSVLMELHNGNVHPLVWWHGRLMHLKDAPRLLDRPYYDRYRGKELRASEWTLLRRYMACELERLDREHKRLRARRYREERKARKGGGGARGGGARARRGGGAEAAVAHPAHGGPRRSPP